MLPPQGTSQVFVSFHRIEKVIRAGLSLALAVTMMGTPQPRGMQAAAPSVPLVLAPVAKAPAGPAKALFKPASAPQFSGTGPCFATPNDGVTVFDTADAAAVQQAVDAASVGGTVKVAGTCAGVQARAGTTQTVVITKALTLAGGFTDTVSGWSIAYPITQPTTLDALTQGRVISATSAVTLSSLTVQNGNTTGDGGGAWFGSTATLIDTDFLSNTVLGENGGGGGANIRDAATLIGGSFINNSIGTNSIGGGLSAGSTLVLTGTQFISNTATQGGGLRVAGAATLNGGLFQNNRVTTSNGGGAYFVGTAILSGTEFVSNTASSGGGVNALGAVMLNGVLFMSNTVAQFGGGLRAQSTLALTNTQFIDNTSQFNSGGGLYHSGTNNGRVVNTLFAENSARNGAAASFASAGNVEIIHATVASPTLTSGSAFYVGSGTVNITNTLIASHTVGIERAGGTATEDYTLFSGVTTPTSGTITSGGNSITGTAAFFNTTAYTLTANSDAIDAGTNAGVTTDAFGNARPQGAGFDIGFDEFVPPPLLCFATPDNGTTVFSSSDASAVQNAVNAASAGGTVKVAGTCAGVQATAGTTQTVVITKALTLAGGFTTTNWTTPSIANVTVLDAQTAGRVISATAAVTVSDLIVQRGNIIGNGGGAWFGSSATLSGATAISNAASNIGGGAYFAGATVMTGTQFISNVASTSGGAYIIGTATVTGSRFSGNRATSNNAGGAWFGGATTLTSTVFTTNTASQNGGGAYFGNFANVTNSSFTGNTSLSNNGGGAFFFGVSTLAGTTFISNTAALQGGGANFGASTTLLNTTFISNTAGGWGGGAHAANVATITGGLFQNNTGDRGGGLNANNSLVLSSTQFLSNTATIDKGGGAYVAVAATLNGGLFQNNRSADDSGGGLAVANLTSLTDTQFISNAASSSGGGAYLIGPAVIRNATFSRNGAGSGGGAIFFDTTSVSGTVFVSNTASGQAAGALFEEAATITSTQFISNVSASTGGGAVFNEIATLTGTTFNNNNAVTGAGAFFSQPATLTNTQFFSNTASNQGGGASFARSANIQGGLFDRNNASSGGGAYFGFSAVVTSTQSTFSNNRAAAGGAFFLQNTGVFSSVVFLNNAASSNGGVLYFNQQSAAPASLIVNSVMSGNRAGVSGNVIYVHFFNQGRIDLVHNTIASPTVSSSAAIVVLSGTVNLTNTIIASYTTGINRSAGTVNEDYNLFSGVTTPTTGTVNSGGNSITGTAGFVNPASDNYRILNTSSAVNAGTNAGITTDFDGNTRPFGAGFDIGAFEVQSNPPVAGVCFATPDNGTTVFSSANADAVQQAVNAASAGGTVKVAGMCAGTNTQGGSTQTVVITKALTLAGGFTTTNWSTYDPISNPTTLDARSAGRVVSASVAATLQGFTVTNGYLASDLPLNGGGIFAASAMTLTDMSVVSNTVINVGLNGNHKRGGGAYIAGAALVTSTSFISNTAQSQGVADNRGGGGLWVGGTASVTGSTFISNVAYVFGAGAYFDSAATVVNSTFRNNRGTHFSVSGGAGATFNVTSTVIGSTFAGNTVNNGGAGAQFLAGAVITSSTFSNNTAGGPGGGMLVNGGASIAGSVFLSNSAYSFGGGAYLAGAAVITGSTFRENIASLNSGGGVYIGGFAALTNSTFLTNNAWASGVNGGGGGAYLAGASSVSGNTFTGNRTGSSARGGGAYFTDASAVESSTFINNASTQPGGGAFFNSAASVTGTAFISNTSTASSGGGAAFNSAARLGNTQFISNLASMDGGGAWFSSTSTLDGGVFQQNLAGASQEGGGAYFAASATLSGTQFISNTFTSLGAGTACGVSAACGGGGFFAGAASATFTNTHFSGNAARFGGGLFTLSTLTMTGSQFSSNTAQGSGGGARANGAVTLNGGLFQNNIANAGGGLTTDDTLVLTDTQFVSNTASLGGGAVANGAATLTGGLFQNNRSTSSSGIGAGGLYASSTLQMTGTQFISNTANSNGGGAYFNAGGATLTRTTFISNSASSFGGGLFNTAGVLRVSASQFTDNSANSGGGGLYNNFGGRATVDASTFTSNTTATGGGAIFNSSTTSLLTVTNGSLIQANTAIGAGGGLLNSAGIMRVFSSTVVSNTALSGGSGGGFYNQTGGQLIIDGSEITSNQAGLGGGIFMLGTSSVVTITNSRLLSNTGTTNGGAIYQQTGSTRVIDSCIVGNSASAINYFGGTSPMTATANWWGSASGPSGTGTGVGDSVSSNVDFSGFLGAAILGCPALPNPDVTIRKTAAPSSGLAGSAITYTLAFSNAGPGSAGGVVITDSVPASVTINSVSSSGATITQTSGAPNFAWQVSALAPNSGGVITLAGTISASAVAGMVITNTAVITAGGDSNALNNSATAPFTVTAPVVCFATPDEGVTVFSSANADAVQQAVDAASAGDTVKVAGTCAGVQSRGGNNQTVYIDKALTLAGGFTNTNWTTPTAANITTLDALYGGRVIFASVAVTIANLIVQNGVFTEGVGAGGGAWFQSTAVVTGVTFLSNTATNAGGAYFNNAAVLTHTNFISNTASNGGGAGFQGPATLVGGAFLSNTATTSSGGAAFGSPATLSGTIFSGNRATTGIAGGAGFSNNAALTNTSFTSNTASSGGGAYFINDATLSGVAFISNTATGTGFEEGGGGAYVKGAATVVNSHFERNAAALDGGGLMAYNTLALTGTQFISNTAASSGGGAVAIGAATINGGLFQNNTSNINDVRYGGGGLYAYNTLTLTGTQFISNTATRQGGGAVVRGATTLNGGLFMSNTASNAGGGLSVEGAVVLTGTQFISNSASSGGGMDALSSVTLNGGLFTGNIASTGGGLYASNTLTLTGTQFLSNTATSVGGGLLVLNRAMLNGGLFQNNQSIGNIEGGGAVHASDALALTGTQFINNSANLGGAMYLYGSANASRIVNAGLFRNHATSGEGDAIYLVNWFETGTLDVIHTTIASPTLALGNAIAVFTGTVNITNTLIASHTVGIENAGGTVNENYTLFSGVTTPYSGTVTSGGNSITGTAGFVDPANDNYRLTGASSAVNTGTNAGISTDFDGNSRPLGAGFDIGAFEFDNGSPVANAGQSQTVTVSTLVTLTGVASSDPESGALVFGWSQTSGTPVTLNDSSTISPTFTAPATTGTLVFQLVVTDTAGETSAPAFVTVTVTNSQPIADAGSSQNVSAGAAVTLNGSASSDPEGHALTFGWTQTSGDAATLNNTSAVSPTFTAPITPGTLVFQLVVTDAFGLASAPVFVTVTVVNGQPTANAGALQSVTVNTPVALNGSGSSDPDGHALTFGWSQVSGAAVTLDNSAAVSPTFTAPGVTGELVFQLIVTDAFGLASTPALVTVTVTNGEPTANAGAPQTVTVNTPVTLTGVASSDPDGHTLTFGWSQVSGAAVTLDNSAAVSPTFTAPGVTGELVFQLVVTDAFGLASAPALVTVTVTNGEPTANAGAPQTVTVNTPVALNGSASSDPDGHALTFGWSQFSGTPVLLSSNSAVSPTFTAPNVAGPLVFQLIVTDAFGLASAPALVTVTVTNGEPTANAGLPQTGFFSNSVTLDGSASSDPENQPLTFGWSQVSGTPVLLSNNTAVSPTFIAPAITDTLVFHLVVTDSVGLPSAPAFVTVTVEMPQVTTVPPDSAAITLTTGIARLQPSTDFTATLGSGDEPVIFTWDFGDGSPLFTGPVASHVYAPGVYTATLTATNSAGTVTTTIRVFVPWRMLLAIIVKDSTLPMLQQR